MTNKDKRKAIWIIEDNQVIQKRPKISEQRKFKPFWNSVEEAERHLPRKALWIIEDGEIIQKRPRICDHKNYDPHWTSREKAEAALSLDYTLTRGSLTIYYNDQSLTVTASDKRYIKLRAACKNNDINAIFRLVNLSSVLDEETSAFTMKKNKIFLDKDELPKELSHKIINALKSDNVESLEKFWLRLKKNPDSHIRENLYKFISNHGMTITKNGTILGYKYVNDDYTDCYSKSYDFTPGNVVKMPREKCDNNPNNTCSSGLHVGTWHYSGGSSKTVLLVEVDPLHVVSIPNEYGSHKMRCCQMTSIKQVTSPIDDSDVADVESLLTA